MLTRRSAVRAFTLIEVVLALVMLGVIAAALLAALAPQQRLLRAVRELVEARRTLDDGARVLRYDLRAIAPGAGGIYDMAEDHLEFRAVSGASVVCAIDAARTELSLAPRVDEGPALTAWVTAPMPGDTALLYADGESDSARWIPYEIAAPSSLGPPCPDTLGLTPGGARLLPSVTLRATTAVEPSVRAGAAVRITRRARYALYRAADGKWYLGYTDCLVSRAVPCAAIQPVAGPYQPGGMRMTYADSAGAVAVAAAQVAWIDVIMRPLARAPSVVVGLPHGDLADSLRITIAPRN